MAIIGLIFRELTIAEPIVNLRLLKNRAFAISNVVMFLFGFIIQATTQLLPQLTQDLAGYDATTAGMTLALGAFATIAFMPIAGIVTGRLVQPRWLVFAALVGSAFAMRFAAGLDIQSDFFNFSVARVIQVVWMPFIFIPLSAVQFIGVPEGKNNEASATINMVRNIGGSIGLAVASTMLSVAGTVPLREARRAHHRVPRLFGRRPPCNRSLGGGVRSSVDHELPRRLRGARSRNVDRRAVGAFSAENAEGRRSRALRT